MTRFVSFVLLATLAGLCYVTAEVEAVKVGYQIRKQEEKKIQALDRARVLKYSIARLEAPQTLEKRLLAQKIELAAPREWQTLNVSTGNPSKTLVRPALGRPPFFGKFLIGTAQAEAKETFGGA